MDPRSRICQKAWRTRILSLTSTASQEAGMSIGTAAFWGQPTNTKKGMRSLECRLVHPLSGNWLASSLSKPP